MIAFLIIIGGVGFLTWNDIREHKLHFRRYRLQSKLILTTTLALILTGLLFFLLYEFEQGQWVGPCPCGSGSTPRFFSP